MRAWEQIRTTIAHDNLSVKIAVSHAGLTNGPDGLHTSHWKILALMRVIPNMSVIVPCDANETKSVVISESPPRSCIYRIESNQNPGYNS